MRQTPPLQLLLGLVCACALLSGCSFSASSKSISASISSPFESSSESSKSDQQRYEDDVADYTGAFISAGGGAPGTFQKGISALASDRGISDWESNPGTWKAVGRGLALAKVNEAELQAYQESWTYGDAARMSQIRAGYDAAR